MSEGITIDLKSLEAAAAKICLPKETVDKIMGLAVSRTSKWAARYLKSELRKATKIEGKVLKGRMRVKVEQANASGEVWLGLNPIPADKFNPTQTPSGVKTDVKEFPHAFIGGGTKGSGLVFIRDGKSRLPIRRVLHEIEPEGMSSFERTVAKIETRLGLDFERAYSDVVVNLA